MQQHRDIITGTMIPDRDVDHGMRNCQRGFESLKTIDMKATGHQLWRSLRARDLRLSFR